MSDEQAPRSELESLADLFSSLCKSLQRGLAAPPAAAELPEATISRLTVENASLAWQLSRWRARAERLQAELRKAQGDLATLRVHCPPPGDLAKEGPA